MSALAGFSTPALAFNTGGHFTATHSGLAAAGFSRGAIKYAQVANYQVDYWTNYFSWSTDGVRNERAIEYSQYYHFDDLPDAKWVVREFAWHETSTKHAIEKAVRDNKPGDVLIALGILLHSTQDFYAHSTMADVDWTRWVGKPIVIFETLPDDIRLNPKLAIKTGRAHDFHDALRPSSENQPAVCKGNSPAEGCWPQHLKEAHADHPEVCAGNAKVEVCGVNKDSYERRGHFIAREMAADSTKYWVDKAQRWINNDAFWTRVKTYSNDESAGCWDRAHGMSVYAGQWGRWKLRGVAQNLGVAAENAHGCGDFWQDETFNDVFVAMHRDVDPSVYQVPARTGAQRGSFIGTYDMTWGTLTGVLALRADGDFRTGTWTIGNERVKNLRRAKPDGNAFDIAIDDGPTGRIFINGQNGLAGFVRLSGNEQRPTGFFATKRR